MVSQQGEWPGNNATLTNIWLVKLTAQPVLVRKINLELSHYVADC